MPVRAIKNEPKCKICQSPKRDEIDKLLEMRSNAERLSTGVRATLVTITPLIEAYGVVNPTKENLTNHLRKHCEIVTAGTQMEISKAAQETLKILESDGGGVDVDGSLRRMFAIGMAELEAKIASGQRSGIGPDLMVKITDAITRRKASDAQSELLRAMGGGIAAALGGGKVKAIETGHDEIEAPAFEIEDAEFEEVA